MLNLILAILLNTIAYGNETNILMGKWKNSSEDCQRPWFIFEQKKITKNTDADGSPLKFEYENVSYAISKDQITVDFGKNHGIGGLESKSKIDIKVISPSHVQIVRAGKKKSTDLLKCP